MADDLMRRLLGEQRRRMIGGVLGAIEGSSAWSRMPVPEQRALREKVLQSAGNYHDFCLDVIKVSGEDGVRNEHALTLLQQIHDSQRRVERDLREAVVAP